MKQAPWEHLEKYRMLPSGRMILAGFIHKTGDGFGIFEYPIGKNPLKIIVGNGDGWEHVSVSLPNRCPTWAEMCIVKDLFWKPEECVMQLHPPASEHVNCHPYCLHLWRPTIGPEIPRPPSIMVGPDSHKGKDNG